MTRNPPIAGDDNATGVGRLGVGYATPYLGVFREEAIFFCFFERCSDFIAVDGEGRCKKCRPAACARGAGSREGELPLAGFGG